MGFFAAVIVWLIIAACIATGIVMALKGSAVLLIVSLVVFILAFARYGCLTH